MSLFSRLKDLFRSETGHAINEATDPAKVLEQLDRDSRDKIPQMRARVASVMANKTELERQVSSLKQAVVVGDSNIRRAMEKGKEDLAKEYLRKKKVDEARLKSLEEQLKTAAEEADGAQSDFNNYLDDLQRQHDQIVATLNEAQRAEATQHFAEVRNQLSTQQMGNKVSEMTDRIHRQSAEAHANLQLANDTPENRIRKAERELEETSLEDELAAYRKPATQSAGD